MAYPVPVYSPAGSPETGTPPDGCHYGVFSHGGALYAICLHALNIFAGSAWPSKTVVSKSTDGGLTWTEMDTANEKLLTSVISNDGAGFTCVAAGDTIWFCYYTGTFGFTGVTGFRTSLGLGYSAALGVGTTNKAPHAGIGSGFAVNIVAVDSVGAPTSLTISNPGVNYAVGDTGIINGGSAACAYVIQSIGAGGAVITFQILSGLGYSIANQIATTTGGPQPGSGQSLLVDITAVNAQGSPTSLNVDFSGNSNGYAVGDTGTINGGTAPTSYVITDTSIAIFTDTPVTLSSFVMGPDQYGPTFPNGPKLQLTVNYEPPQMWMVRLSNGTLVFIYNHDTLSNTPILWAQFSGGVWSNVDSTFAPSDGGTNALLPAPPIVDASDRIHVLYRDGTITKVKYRSLVAGVVSAETLVDTNSHGFPVEGAGGGGGPFGGHGCYCPSPDAIRWPVLDITGTPGNFKDRLRVFTGSPTAAPLFTFENVIVNAPTQTIDGSDEGPPFMLSNPAGTIVYLLRTDNSRLVSTRGRLLYYSKIGAGAWGPEVLLYDDAPIPLPRPNDPSQLPIISLNGLSSVTALWLDDSPNFGILFGAEDFTSSNTKPFEVIYYFQPLCPPPSSVCIPVLVGRIIVANPPMVDNTGAPFVDPSALDASNKVGLREGLQFLDQTIYQVVDSNCASARYIIRPNRSHEDANTPIESLQAWKSVYGGQWIQQDAAHHPIQETDYWGDAATHDVQGWLRTSVSGQIIYIGCLTQTQHLQILRFDCSTDTWMTPLTTAGPLIPQFAGPPTFTHSAVGEHIAYSCNSNGAPFTYGLVERTMGTKHIFFYVSRSQLLTTYFFNQLTYVIFDGAVWSAPTVMYSADDHGGKNWLNPWSVVAGITDLAHLMFGKQVDATGNSGTELEEIWQCTLDLGTGLTGTAQLVISTALGAAAQLVPFDNGVPISFAMGGQTHIGLPLVMKFNIGPFSALLLSACLMGISAVTPTWGTLKQIAQGPDDPPQNLRSQVAAQQLVWVPNSSTLYCFFIVDNGAAHPITSVYVAKSADMGVTWSTPLAAYIHNSGAKPRTYGEEGGNEYGLCAVRLEEGGVVTGIGIVLSGIHASYSTATDPITNLNQAGTFYFHFCIGCGCPPVTEGGNYIYISEL